MVLLDVGGGNCQFVEQVEQRAMWNLEAILQRALVEPLGPKHSAIIEGARAKSKDK